MSGKFDVLGQSYSRACELINYSVRDKLTFPFKVDLAFGAAVLFFAGAGGRGDAARCASGPGDPSSAAEDTTNKVLESFGVVTNPGWGRTGLGGQRLRLDV